MFVLCMQNRVRILLTLLCFIELRFDFLVFVLWKGLIKSGLCVVFMEVAVMCFEEEEDWEEEDWDEEEEWEEEEW